MEVDGGHDAVVLALLVDGEFGAGSEEKEEDEGGETVEVADGDDFVTAAEGRYGGEGECADVGCGDDGAVSVAAVHGMIRQGE